MTCLFPLTPSQFPFNRLPDELGTAFALLQNRVDPVQRPLGESGRGALVVDLLPTHALKIGDITYCYKPYFSLASGWIDDIIFASERRQAMTNQEAREIFNQAIRNTQDADSIANIELCREYFTNPTFRKALEDHLWETRAA